MAVTTTGFEGDDRLVGADRVLAVLKLLGRHPEGVALEELAREVASPKSTVHRALASLRRAGLAERHDGRRYRLGSEFLRIAFDYHARRPEHLLVLPLLVELSQKFGETSHYGVLDGQSIVYVAKVDPPTGAVRLTSTVGGRNPAHLTGIGKCLLSYTLDSATAVQQWAGGTRLAVRTSTSVCTTAALYEELVRTRRRGYAIDDQENEFGVNCLAVPLWLGASAKPSGALSISGLAYRTPLSKLVRSSRQVRGLVDRYGWGPTYDTRGIEVWS